MVPWFTPSKKRWQEDGTRVDPEQEDAKPETTRSD